MLKQLGKGGDFQEQIHKATTAIAEADAMLITAGAGMGVDSGLPDFRGNQGFWRAYPVIAKMGLAFAEMANPKWFERDARLAWGFYGHRLDLYRKTTPHKGFARLLQMGKEKTHGYFVLTSNVDGQFQTAGFDANCIEECHGSLHHLQCTQPCGDEIWHADDLDVPIDAEQLRAIGTLPSCRQCGSMARPNILMFNDGYWIENRTQAQEGRLWKWLEGLTVMTHRLVIVEIGAGHAVPTIRIRSEFYAKAHQATLIRINPDEPPIFKERHISLPMNGKTAIEAIWNIWRDEGRQHPAIEGV